MVGGLFSLFSHAFLVVAIPLAGVGVVGEDWRYQTTGPETVVTHVSSSPPGIVNATIANEQFRGEPIGGYQWRCVAPGEAVVTVHAYVQGAGREPTFSQTVVCVAAP